MRGPEYPCRRDRAYIYDADGVRVAKGTANWGSCDPSVNGFQASTDYVLGPGGEQVTEVTVAVLCVYDGKVPQPRWSDGPVPYPVPH